MRAREITYETGRGRRKEGPREIEEGREQNRAVDRIGHSAEERSQQKSGEARLLGPIDPEAGVGKT